VDEVEPIYDVELGRGKWIHEVADRKWKWKEGRRRYPNLPLLLKLSQHLTTKQLDNLGWIQMNHLEHSMKAKSGSLIPFVKCI
jgi:hypothetical protein